MKAFIIGAGLLGLAATAATAEPWGFPYEKRHHRFCQAKAQELHRYEHRSAADGHLSKREMRTIEVLRSDLARTCHGYRWKG